MWGPGHCSFPVLGAPRQRRTRCPTFSPRRWRAGFASLDASRVWICYWIVHGLKLLGEPLQDPADREAVIAFISTCQQESGGFGGGPYQLAHLAPTYAGMRVLGMRMHCVCVCGGEVLLGAGTGGDD